MITWFKVRIMQSTLLSALIHAIVQVHAALAVPRTAQDFVHIISDLTLSITLRSRYYCSAFPEVDTEVQRQ